MNHASSARPTRREFVAAASVLGAGAMLPARESADAAASQVSSPVSWPIGCHTRPFSSFRASQAGNPDYVLDSIKAAGYQYADMISAAPPGGGRSGARDGGPQAGRGRGVTVTPEMLAAMKQKLAYGD
jgi:hypothetical protein